MGRYVEQYVYDAVGNILSMQHRGNDPIQPVWKRTYSYHEASQLEVGPSNNRLSKTQVGQTIEHYRYDGSAGLHGDITAMPHLPKMRWDFLDQLQATAQQVFHDGTAETTWYVYDATGQRVRKVTECQAKAGQTPTRSKERVYLGGFEIYREYENDGATISLERETLHVMDGQQRIALVETKTITNPDDKSPNQLIRYQFGNHLGSASLELDEKGGIISYEEYTPYGSTSYQAVDKHIKAAAKRYRYTGQERDEETGLNYHGARYYAPWLGRWTAADPTGIADALNLYSYVSANPMIAVDSTGYKEDKPVVQNDELGNTSKPGGAPAPGAGEAPSNPPESPNVYPADLSAHFPRGQRDLLIRHQIRPLRRRLRQHRPLRTPQRLLRQITPRSQ